ncbi:hypothetical protein ACFRJ8_22510 [Arthrobacter sp. NPDC056886]|uniref:hypothetical protein n=1 Tax=Arthrobacter sp. NPDC056886 TaxID=3345960 RepID=UPI00366A6E23
MEAVAASAARLAAFTSASAAAESGGPSGANLPASDLWRDADPLRSLADGYLDGLAEVARLEARTAAAKVRLAAGYAQATGALVPPAASAQDRTAFGLALVAEVACVLTVSERTAGALLAESRALTTPLPLTLAALQAGTISWQHARIIVDETAGLDPAGAGPNRGTDASSATSGRNGPAYPVVGSTR